MKTQNMLAQDNEALEKIINKANEIIRKSKKQLSRTNFRDMLKFVDTQDNSLSNNEIGFHVKTEQDEKPFNVYQETMKNNSQHFMSHSTQDSSNSKGSNVRKIRLNTTDSENSSPIPQRFKSTNNSSGGKSSIFRKINLSPCKEELDADDLFDNFDQFFQVKFNKEQGISGIQNPVSTAIKQTQQVPLVQKSLMNQFEQTKQVQSSNKQQIAGTKQQVQQPQQVQASNQVNQNLKQIKEVQSAQSINFSANQSPNPYALQISQQNQQNQQNNQKSQVSQQSSLVNSKISNQSSQSNLTKNSSMDNKKPSNLNEINTKQGITRNNSSNGTMIYYESNKNFVQTPQENIINKIGSGQGGLYGLNFASNSLTTRNNHLSNNNQNNNQNSTSFLGGSKINKYQSFILNEKENQNNFSFYRPGSGKLNLNSRIQSITENAVVGSGMPTSTTNNNVNSSINNIPSAQIRYNSSNNAANNNLNTSRCNPFFKDEINAQFYSKGIRVVPPNNFITSQFANHSNNGSRPSSISRNQQQQANVFNVKRLI